MYLNKNEIKLIKRILQEAREENKVSAAHFGSFLNAHELWGILQSMPFYHTIHKIWIRNTWTETSLSSYHLKVEHMHSTQYTDQDKRLLYVAHPIYNIMYKLVRQQEARRIMREILSD